VKAQRIQFLDRKGSQPENGIKADEQEYGNSWGNGASSLGTVFPSEASKMDALPWDNPSPQRTRLRSNNDKDVPPDMPF
jgi:hypothetical protein